MIICNNDYYFFCLGQSASVGMIKRRTKPFMLNCLLRLYTVSKAIYHENKSVCPMNMCKQARKINSCRIPTLKNCFPLIAGVFEINSDCQVEPSTCLFFT